MMTISPRYEIILADPDGDEQCRLCPVYEEEVNAIRDTALRSGYTVTLDLAPLRGAGDGAE